MDEMAAATNTDPVDFRLQYLKNPRDRDAVRIAAEHYGWEKRPSPRNDQKDDDVAIGRGIAFRRHFSHLHRAGRRGAGASRDRQDRHRRAMSARMTSA